MNRIPAFDRTATGINITRLRINAGITVRDLQDIFGFNTPQAIYNRQQGRHACLLSLFVRAGGCLRP